jgi:signal transduction histidine kinase
LTLILGPLAHLTENGKPKVIDLKEFPQLQLMKRNDHHLLNLIEEILDLSKLDANKMGLQEQSISLNEFCLSIFYIFESSAQLQNIQFQLDYQVSESLILKIDKNKAEKVLINLLSNAMKSTPTHGEVIFQVLEQKNRLVLL